MSDEKFAQEYFGRTLHNAARPFQPASPAKMDAFKKEHEKAAKEVDEALGKLKKGLAKHKKDYDKAVKEGRTLYGSGG